MKHVLKYTSTLESVCMMEIKVGKSPIIDGIIGKYYLFYFIYNKAVCRDWTKLNAASLSAYTFNILHKMWATNGDVLSVYSQALVTHTGCTNLGLKFSMYIYY